jgi:hypothetical protein
LAHELQIGIGDGRTKRTGTIEVVGPNSVTDSIGMNAQLSGDGADFPMLGVEVVTDLNTSFWTHHFGRHPDRGMRGKGSTKWLLRPQSMQRKNATVRCEGQP